MVEVDPNLGGLRMAILQSRRFRWLLAAILVAANVAAAGFAYRDAPAQELDLCRNGGGHCHCVSNMGEPPYCSHVLGTDVCHSTAECN